MSRKNTIFVLETIVLTILLFIPRVFSDDLIPIPADKSQLNSWFEANVKPLDARKDTLDPALVAAEANKTIVKNSAPRPDGKRELAQAAALRTGGDKASLYNCKMFGFQDTFCDDSGKHFIKDCYIEGTVDFIFGNGKSLYLNTETHVLPGDPMAMITAHARGEESVDSGYSFVHCTVTGTGKSAYLGRAWRPFSKVVFSYTDMSDVVQPEGWSDDGKPDFDKSLYYGEYKCTGTGANQDRRVGYVKKLSDEEAKPFISLAYIEGSKWLLPPVAL